jgi:signal transduction histidine kinase
MLSLSRPDDRDHALEQLHEISDASAEAIDEVKEIIYDLRPIQLDRLGLTGAIRDISEKVAAVNGLRLFEEVEDIDNIFPKPGENSVYRIVQEALNNVVKHSKAGEVRVQVSRGRSEVSLIIRDDGAGFEPNAPGVSRGRIGFGLLGMSERAKLLGGRTTVESAQGEGTKVTVVLPLKADRASLSPGGASR